MALKLSWAEYPAKRGSAWVSFSFLSLSLCIVAIQSLLLLPCGTELIFVLPRHWWDARNLWKRDAMSFQVVIIVKQPLPRLWKLWRCYQPTLWGREEKRCPRLPFFSWSRDIRCRFLDWKKPMVHIFLSGLNLWLFKSKIKARIWHSRFESHFKIML